MTIRDILTLPIEPYMAREAKWLRKNTPLFLKTIIENTYQFSGIKTLSDLTQKSLLALEGGVSSAVYMVKKAEDSFIIKLRYQGVSAEVEAMNAWQAKGASVVGTKKSGQVKSSEQTVKYLIQEGVIRKNGSPAPTAFDYLNLHPNKSYDVGILRGQELAKMHKAKSERTFGEFADMSGKKAPFKTWNAYLLGYFNYHHDYLKKIGLTTDEIEAVKSYISKLNFSKKGTYLHGDFSSRNILIAVSNPIVVRIFDPNPLIGHPSWDMAFVFNSYEIAKKRSRLEPQNKDAKTRYAIEKNMLKGFIEGYELESKQKIDPKKVHSAQFIQLILRLQSEVSRAKKRTKTIWEDKEVIAIKNTLHDIASFMFMYR